MESIDNGEFLTLVRRLGIDLDERCQADDPLWPYWWLPDYQGNWPHFASCFLLGIDPWDSILLWPREGRWPRAPGKPDWSKASRNRLPWSDLVRGLIYRGAQVPEGWVGALRFERHEMDCVVAIMFAHMTFGWCMDDDLFLIPDHGQQLLEVNNDDLVYVKFRDESRVAGFAEQMEANGYR